MSKEDAEALVGRKRDSDLCGFEGAKPEAASESESHSKEARRP